MTDDRMNYIGVQVMKAGSTLKRILLDAIKISNDLGKAMKEVEKITKITDKSMIKLGKIPDNIQGKLEFGDLVLVNHKLVRKENYPNIKETRKYWEKEEIPETTAIIIGRRALTNGIRYWGGYSIEYLPKEYLKVYLVALDMKQNPVYVLPEEIKGWFSRKDNTLRWK